MSLSIYRLKPRFEHLLQPVLASFIRTNVTPNQVTLATLALSLAYGGALAWTPGTAGLWIGLPFFLLLRMALNAIDGMLAIATGNKTPLGAVLNELCDQISDAALCLPFALATGLAAPLVVLVVVAALIAEFAGILAQTIGAPRGFDGPMGKSDRAFAFGVVALLIGFGADAAWCNGLLILMLVLAALTTCNRLRRALRVSEPTIP